MIRSLCLIAPALALLVALNGTWLELGRKLLEDDTYQHGLLVPFICMYLLWLATPRLRRQPSVPWPPGLLLVLGLGVLWAIARLAGVRVVEQYAAVGLIPAVVLAVIGPTATRTIAFPLAYLFLVVPVGQQLVPYLMEFTADFTVLAVRASGIPVYREGMFFSLPSGDFEVAKACSGIRYLMASFATGTLYSYLMFRSWRRRAAFIGFSLLLPVVANGLRAYLIVMLAHLSDMRLAVGVDHLVYGWLFFGVVIAVLLWVGSRFREPETAGGPPDAPLLARDRPHLEAPAAAVAVLAGLAVLAPAVYLSWMMRQLPALPPSTDVGAYPMPDRVGCWTRQLETAPAWRPAYDGALRDGATRYAYGGMSVDVFVAEYASSAPEGREMISYRNQIQTGGEDRRDIVAVRNLQLPSMGAITVAETEADANPRRLVWYWYEVGGVETVSKYRVKALEASSILIGRPAPQRLVAISVPLAGTRADADQALSEALPAVRRMLAGLPTPGADCR